MNRFSVAKNNILFSSLLMLAPVVFGAMFYGTDSILAAASAAMAYLSIVIGERIEA